MGTTETDERDELERLLAGVRPGARAVWRSVRVFGVSVEDVARHMRMDVERTSRYLTRCDDAMMAVGAVVEEVAAREAAKWGPDWIAAMREQIETC